MPVQCTCSTCGAAFFRRPHRASGPRYCSPDCFRRRPRRVECNCATCGASLLRRASTSRGATYCSRRCFDTRDTTIQCTCITCGNSFRREKRRMRGPTYCSRPCFYRRHPRSILFSEDGLKALVPLLDENGDVRSYATIDPSDAAEISRWAWAENGSGYAVRTAWDHGHVSIVRMHRQLMGMTPGNGLMVDHINRNGLDNRRSNLRILTPSQNAQNTSPRVGGTSRYRGVHWNTTQQKWRAVVRDRGVTYSLGAFDSEEAAGEACRKARAWLLPYAVD